MSTFRAAGLLRKICPSSRSDPLQDKSGEVNLNIVVIFDIIYVSSSSIHRSSSSSGKKISRAKILESFSEIERDTRTLRRWLRDGAAYCILAGSGTNPFGPLV